MIIDANGNTYGFEYDSLGRKIRQTENLMDSESGISVLFSWKFEYDPNGNLVKSTDAETQEISLKYDEINRLGSKQIEETGTDEIHSYHYDYDLPSGGSFPIGRLSAVRGCNGQKECLNDNQRKKFSKAYQYDARGRVSRESTFIKGNGQKETIFEYDPSDRIIGLTYPNGGAKIGYKYDVGGNLSVIGPPDCLQESTGSNSCYLKEANYNDQSVIRRAVFGNNTYIRNTYYDASEGKEATDSCSGTRLTYRLKSTQLFNSINPDDPELPPDSTPAGAVRHTYLRTSLEFGYDMVGNICQNQLKAILVDEEGIPIDDNELNLSYQYDNLDRLIGVSSLNTSEYSAKKYEYDKVGNITKKNGQRFKYKLGNRLLAAQGEFSNASYDKNGNVISRINQDSNILGYDFDGFGNLVSVKNEDGNVVESYSYDENGRRFKKENFSSKTTYYYYNRYYGEELHEEDSTKNKRRNHYFIEDQRFMTEEDPQGEKKYYFRDHLGSALRLTGSLGQIRGANWYTPFGEKIDLTSIDTNSSENRLDSPYKYTGKELDATDFYYYESRYYDPVIGRFISRDTIFPDIYDPQQLNQYAYARNNPVKFNDPDGHVIRLAAQKGLQLGSLGLKSLVSVANGGLGPATKGHSVQNVAGKSRFGGNPEISLGGVVRDNSGAIIVGANALDLGATILSGDLEGSIEGAAGLAKDIHNLSQGKNPELPNQQDLIDQAISIATDIIDSKIDGFGDAFSAGQQGAGFITNIIDSVNQNSPSTSAEKNDNEEEEEGEGR